MSTTQTPAGVALDLVARGFAIVEVAHTLPDGTCTCRNGPDCRAPGKHPVGKDWLAKALAVRAGSNWRATAERRLRLVPRTSYGLVPPPGSGLMVIDRDADVPLPMPATFEVHRTSAPAYRGHFYFGLADDIDESEVPRSFAGGEVRVGGSGHVVGPGCRHASGDTYEFNRDPIGIADRVLIDALVALPPVKLDAEGAVEAVEGSRHAWLVGQARKYAGWGWDEERIAEQLRTDNDEKCTPPLDEREGGFDRMATWAVTHVEPDAAVVTFRTRRKPKAEPWGWMR